MALLLASVVAVTAHGAGAGSPLVSPSSNLASSGGSFRSVRASAAPISCALAKTLARAKVRPVWFPAPQPAGRFSLNASVPMFGPSLEWTSGRRYLFLGRVPGGANLGAPFPKQVASPYLTNFHSRLKLWRLARAEGGRLYAQWPTFNRYPDLTYAVAKGETIPQFVAFLRSLRRIVWPSCGAD